MRGKLLVSMGVAIAALAALQFVQPERSNPPADPKASFEALAAPSQAATAVVGRACKDCHSNETSWPWYSRVSPVSWMVARDVTEGRARLNLSEWNRYGAEMSALRLRAMCQEVRRGEMPMWQYRLIHSGARLSPADVESVCAVAAPPPAGGN